MAKAKKKSTTEHKTLENLPAQYDDVSAGKGCSEHVLLAWTSAANYMHTVF